ncbi:BTB/POZ/Kelch-associated protein [Klebsormidium nitens]|uniref:BTB/POZ/Kelch-associated protein n=1 Tax=Klebsormidium nitens TaxID=105231 RepID=A0A1Y1IGY4_KLENI|nr:BTB/POZ/Kelch-associated protein [Klebsormidium nitens]|eukprot:GAQ88321.1 BTB/POZ/Kelch-associated protein [Klebsormidium nitens]
MVEEDCSKCPGAVSTLGDALDEEGHYFDFIKFYKKVEFCDRSLRLEILKETRKGPTSANDEELPINSIVVAAKSVVLQKMLSTGMKEANKSAPVVIKVTAEEKTAFKEMLHFLYAGSLSPRLLEATIDVRELVALLVLGDKFEVPSLMGTVVRCISTRRKCIPDSTVLATEIPDTRLQLRQVKKLADDARAHVVETYADVSGTWESEAFMSLSLEVIEILMQAEELEAENEEEIVEKLLGWIRGKYDALSARRRVVRDLTPHIRFFSLTGEALERFLSTPEMQSKGTETNR